MKILLVSDYFPPHAVGGAEISAYNLAVGLSKLGHEVSVLTRFPKGTKVNTSFRIHVVMYKKRESMLYHRLHTGILSSLSLSKKLVDLLRKEEFDVIHAHNWISAYSVKHAKKKIEIPSVLSIRDYRYLCPSLYGWCLGDSAKIECNLLKTMRCSYEYSNASLFVRSIGIIPYALLRDTSHKMLASSLSAFNAYITNSNFLRRVVLNNLNLNNVYTVYNSVDMEKFKVNSSREDKVKILYAGRFDTGKGVEYLIGAVPEVIKKHGNCLFLFVGSGALRKWAENLARKINKSNILFEGFVPYDRMSRYYQLCDIVVVPSVWPEPFGRSVIEAMACGKPTIATKVGGIPELMEDGKTGLLVEPASSEEIASAISTLLDDEKKREKMGKRGRKIAERKYNNEVIARKVLMVYENIL